MARPSFAKPLSPTEEKKVIDQLQSRCVLEQEAAKQRLIEHNMRLVSYIANRYKGARYELEDLISIGTFGLIKAVSSFALDKNVKFVTYASRCIQNEILMHLRQTKKNQQEVSMEETLRQDSEGNRLSMLDIMGTKKDEIEHDIHVKDTFAIIQVLLDELPPDEKTLICYRFGIGTPKKKQKEIADLLNISQSYVSRIEKKALRKIKQRYDNQTQVFAIC